MYQDNNSAVEEHTCPNCGAVHTHRVVWSWPKFIIGKMGNKFIAFSAYMVLQFILLIGGFIAEASVNTLLIVSGAITGIFMLAGAVDYAVSRAEIKAQIGKQL